MMPPVPAGAAVLGVGCDLTEVARIRGVIERQGEAFLSRVFTPAERAYCEGMKYPEINYSARFAAKEAVSKALGTGIGAEVAWTGVEVAHGARGEPVVVLDSAAAARLRELGADTVLLSLSHTRELAMAVALVVRLSDKR